jgi:hypothetical protein
MFISCFTIAGERSATANRRRFCGEVAIVGKPKPAARLDLATGKPFSRREIARKRRPITQLARQVFVARVGDLVVAGVESSQSSPTASHSAIFVSTKYPLV